MNVSYIIFSSKHLIMNALQGMGKKLKKKKEFFDFSEIIQLPYYFEIPNIFRKNFFSQVNLFININRNLYEKMKCF